MPERKRRKKRGISPGSLLALVFTVVVVGASLLFIARMGGDDMDVSGMLNTLTQTLEIPGLNASGTKKQEARDIIISPQATPMPAQTPMPQASIAPAPTMRVVEVQAVGAISAPRSIRQGVYAQESQTYDFTEVFDAVRGELMQGDLTIATTETAFAGKGAEYSNFCAPAELLDALKASGVDLLSMATERALERGYAGLTESIAQIQSRGFLLAGVYENEEEVGTAQLFQINDVQIAVLAYTYGLSDEAKKQTNKALRFSSPLTDLESMKSDIANARKAGAEVVIVLPHWGTKNKAEVPAGVKAMAQALVDSGADIILGTHPNVVQGVEALQATRSDGTQPTCYVAYSLGSFLTDSRDASNTAGVILSLRITVDPATRAVTIDTPVYTPTYIHNYKSDGQSRYAIISTLDDATRAQLDEKAQSAADKARQRVEKSMESGAAVIRSK